MLTLTIFALALSLPQGGLPDQPLVKIKPVSQTAQTLFGSDISVLDSPFSMSGQAYGTGLTTESNLAGEIVYFIPAGRKRFVAEVGYRDGVEVNSEHLAMYYIKVDGELVSGAATSRTPEGILVRGSKPKKVNIDVSGKKSIEIHLQCGASLGDPAFSNKAADGESEGPKVAGKRPVPASPPDNAFVSGDAVTLKWSPVEGAATYGISIVSFGTKEDDVASPRIWSATVRSGTSYSFSLKDLPNGQYLWSVVAFGPKKPLGAFSAERVFTLER